MKRILTALGIAAPATMALVALIGATSPRGGDAAAMISALLDYDTGDCTMKCMPEACDDGHALWKGSQNEDNYGTGTHKCYERARCGKYVHPRCSPGGSGLSDLETVLELVSEMPVREVIAMHETEPNLFFHSTRQAVQVLGCGGLVVAMIELTASQKADLEAIAE
ncbi:MAG: hypothetical protein OXU69_06445 [Gemmatimonadota bacterium]|nr:hypothetical protein [Gemmatimonadota bacterium]MDE2984326.1 hypothetical protein [Gemmatimonadota bacterium]